MHQTLIDDFIQDDDDDGLWDCKACGLTYDPTIESKPKTETCSICRYLLKKKKDGVIS